VQKHKTTFIIHSNALEQYSFNAYRAMIGRRMVFVYSVKTTTVIKIMFQVNDTR